MTAAQRRAYKALISPPRKKAYSPKHPERRRSRPPLAANDSAVYNYTYSRFKYSGLSSVEAVAFSK